MWISTCLLVLVFTSISFGANADGSGLDFWCSEIKNGAGIGDKAATEIT